MALAEAEAIGRREMGRTCTVDRVLVDPRGNKPTCLVQALIFGMICGPRIEVFLQCNSPEKAGDVKRAGLRMLKEYNIYDQSMIISGNKYSKTLTGFLQLNRKRADLPGWITETTREKQHQRLGLLTYLPAHQRNELIWEIKTEDEWT